MIDAVITAGGRLPPELAARYGTAVKACAVVGGETLLGRTVAALRGVPAVARIAVIGPEEARGIAGADEFVVEGATGEANVLAALRASRADRTLFCASDMPFVSARSLADLLVRAPEPACAVYPIYSREEFQRAYPDARSSFALLADGAWTGASVFVVRAAVLMRHARTITRAFGARKSLPALAALFGPALLFAYLRAALRVADIEARCSALLGAPVIALRGADPALAADCDAAADFAYAEAFLARPST